MKVYVDKLPVDCLECVCFDNATGCEIGKGKVHCDYNKRPYNCPLQLLSDYTKQVRKEVVQEIREIIKQEYPVCYLNMGEELFNSEEVFMKLKTVTKILDQIQGEDR